MTESRNAIDEAFRLCDVIEFRKIDGGWEAHFHYGDDRPRDTWIPLAADGMAGRDILENCCGAWAGACKTGDP